MCQKRVRFFAGLMSLRYWLCSIVIIIVVIISVCLVVYPDILLSSEKTETENRAIIKEYRVVDYPTPNYDKEKSNHVLGVVLHHTAEPTVEKSLAILTSPIKKVGTHVVIDTDGTRYVMADPNIATYHAGRSILNGHEGCNYCTVGIEFQGNTLVAPLTDDQIASGIEYIMPIMAKYNIPLKNIVTHEMVRNAYMQKYPNKRSSAKVDITPTEYSRFMKALKPAWEKYIVSKDSPITKKKYENM